MVWARNRRLEKKEGFVGLRYEKIVLLFIVAMQVSACPKRTTLDLQAYQPDPHADYMGGVVTDLYPSRVINRRDFSYALAFSPDGLWVAYTHMVSTDFQLSVVEVQSGALQFNVSLNATEFDVEGLVFIDNQTVAVSGRRSPDSNHPSLRLFDRRDGTLLAAAYDDDLAGLTQVAVSADGRLIATVGVHTGALIIRDAKTLAWRGQVPAHRGPARALAFLPNGELLTGGDDKQLLRWRLEPMPARRQAAVQVPIVKVGATQQQAIPVSFAGHKPLIAVIDAGFEHNVVSTSLVKQEGLADLGMTQTLRSQAGETQAKIVRGSLQIKDLAVADLEFAVCDSCLPVGCDLLLGQDFQSRVSLAPGAHPSLLLVTASQQTQNVVSPQDGLPPQGADASSATNAHVLVAKQDPAVPAGLFFRPVKIAQQSLAGSINDISLSRDGAQIVVAISQTPAERSLELYEREKAGKYPDPNPANAAVLIDSATGTVLRSFVGHRAYVVTAALSPDGKTLASGAWDNHVLLFDVATGAKIFDQPMGWLLRRLRFAPDGRTLGVAAWTPVASFGGDSKPAMVLFDLVYKHPQWYPPALDSDGDG